MVLDELNDNAHRLQLISDLNRNYLLLNRLWWQTERKSLARQALQLSVRTGFISHFVVEGEAMAQQLRQLL